MRPGAWVAEVTGLFDLAGWPPGMRLMVRRERPHPGAQLRITDCDGHRITVRHQHHPRATGRPGTSAPPPGPRRGPPPLRERHRAGQPAAARLRPEPDLVRHRRARRRPARLDADPRAHRALRPPVGTPATAAAAALDRRTPRDHRPPTLAAPGRHRHHSPTWPSTRSTASTPWPLPVERPGPRTDDPRNRPARGTGAHPSDLGRTVTPRCSLLPTRGKNPDDEAHDHDRERSGLGPQFIQRLPAPIRTRFKDPSHVADCSGPSVRRRVRTRTAR